MFAFDSKHADIFGRITTEYEQRGYLAIVLDGELQSAPFIKTRILDGSGVIEGSFTDKEAFNLANHPYFGQPSFNCNVSPPASTTAAVPSCSSSSTFGRITSLQGDPRSMQFSLRFAF